MPRLRSPAELNRVSFVHLEDAHACGMAAGFTGGAIFTFFYFSEKSTENPERLQLSFF